MLLEQDWQPVRPPVFAHPRLGLPAKSRRLARRIIRLPTTPPAQPLPKSRRLARRIIPRKIPPARLGGSFSFRLHRLNLPKIPPACPADRSPPRKIPPARPADHSASDYLTGSTSPKSRRLARRIVPSQNPAGSPGGSFGLPDYLSGSTSRKSRRLARRIVPRKIPPACPADRSASDYLTGSAWGAKKSNYQQSVVFPGFVPAFLTREHRWL